MTKNENTIEDEIDAIRLNLYERTKNMSPKELIAFIKMETEPIHKKFGTRSISSIDEEISRRNTVNWQK
jgi:hypothetical protein